MPTPTNWTQTRKRGPRLRPVQAMATVPLMPGAGGNWEDGPEGILPETRKSVIEFRSINDGPVLTPTICPLSVVTWKLSSGWTYRLLVSPSRERAFWTWRRADGVKASDGRTPGSRRRGSAVSSHYRAATTYMEKVSAHRGTRPRWRTASNELRHQQEGQRSQNINREHTRGRKAAPAKRLTWRCKENAGWHDGRHERKICGGWSRDQTSWRWHQR